MAYDQIVEELRRGASRRCGSLPQTPRTRGCSRIGSSDLIDKLDFLVVQDMFPTTETAAARTCFCEPQDGERKGTLINSERRIGLVKSPPSAGQALADFHIFRLIAHSWGVW